MQAIFNKKTDVQNLPSGLVGGAFSLTLSTVVVKILGLIYKIPLSSILGDEGMGYFNSAYTVYAFFYLLCTAGVPKAVMIMISEAKAKGRTVEENKVLRVAIMMFLFLGIGITALFIIFSGWLANLIGNSKSAFTMIAIAPSIIFISLAGVIRGYLSANTRLPDIAFSQIIEGIGKLVLGIFFAVIGQKLNLPLEVVSAFTILGVSFGSLFGLLYLLICSKIKITDGKNDTKSEGSLKIAKKILSISIPITLSASIMSITNIIDLGLIMRSLSEIGYSQSRASALYGNYTTLAVPMLNLAVSLITPISIAFLPTFTKHIVKCDSEGLLDAKKSALNLTAFISAPITIGLMIFPKEILDLLFPNSETNIGAALLFTLAPSIIFSSILVNVNTILEAYGKVKVPLISMIFGSLAKIIVSNILITQTDLQILGAPIGTVVSYAVALMVSLIIYANEFKENLPLLATYLAPYALAFCSVKCARIVYDGSPKKTVFLFLAIILSALIYLTLSGVLLIFKKGNLKKLAKSTKMQENFIQ